MHVTVIEEPGVLLELDETKQHLHVDHDDDNALITSLIAAVSGAIDGPGGRLDRSIGLQTLEARLATFGCREIVLPYGPIVTVTSVKYLDDAAGAEQTLSPSVYQVLADGRVRLKVDQSWPALYDDEEAVRVLYVAGYEDVPQPVKTAALLMIGFLYANREASADDALQGGAAQLLLAPYRIQSV